MTFLPGSKRSKTEIIFIKDTVQVSSASESRLLLLKARIDYAASIYKFKVALEERIY